MQEMRVQSLDQEEPLEKGMATYSGLLAWRTPWTEEPDRLQSRGLQSQTWPGDRTKTGAVFKTLDKTDGFQVEPRSSK